MVWCEGGGGERGGGFVASGSDEGHVFVWEAASGRLLRMLGGGGQAGAVPCSLAVRPDISPKAW